MQIRNGELRDPAGAAGLRGSFVGHVFMCGRTRTTIASNSAVKRHSQGCSGTFPESQEVDCGRQCGRPSPSSHRSENQNAIRSFGDRIRIKCRLDVAPLPIPSDASGIGLQDYNWVSGWATAVVIDPNDGTGNTVFAGGAYGGLWKSVNAAVLSPNPGAVIWTPLTDDQATLAMGAIAVQPQTANPNPSKSAVLVGTGETNSSGDSYYGLGILRSADGGQSWTLISQDASGLHSFAGLGFSHIAFSTANTNLAVAAAGSASEGIIEGLETPVASNRGLYYATDAGISWHSATATDSGASISPPRPVRCV